MSIYWTKNEKGIIPFETILKDFISDEFQDASRIEAALRESEAYDGLMSLSFEISHYFRDSVFGSLENKKAMVSVIEYLIDEHLRRFDKPNAIQAISLILKFMPALLRIESPHTKLIPLHYLLTCKVYSYGADNSEDVNQEEFENIEKKILTLIQILATAENINDSDHQGFTALHHVCNLAFISTLTQNDDEADNDLEIPLFSVKIVEALLAIKNIKVNMPLPETQKTALVLVAENRIAEHFIESSPENIDEDLYEMGKKVINLLLSHGADIDVLYVSHAMYSDETVKTTLLHYGAKCLEYDYFKLLIKSAQFNPKKLYEVDDDKQSVMDYLLERKESSFRKNMCYLILRKIYSHPSAFKQFIETALVKLTALNSDKKWLDETKKETNENVIDLDESTPTQRTERLIASNERLMQFLKMRKKEYLAYESGHIHWVKSLDKFCYRTSKKDFYVEGQNIHFMLKAKRSIVSKANPNSHVATAALSFFVTSRFGKNNGVHLIELGNKFNEHISDLITSQEYPTHLATHLQAFEGQTFFVNKEQERAVNLNFNGPNLAQNFNHSEQAAFKWLLNEANMDAIIQKLIDKLSDFGSYNFNHYKVKAVILHIDSELYMCHHCQPMALALQKNGTFTKQLEISLKKREMNTNSPSIRFTVALSADKPFIFTKRKDASEDDYRFTEADHQALSIDLRSLPTEHLFLKDTCKDEINISAFFSQKDAEKTKLSKKITELEEKNNALKKENNTLKTKIHQLQKKEPTSKKMKM